MYLTKKEIIKEIKKGRIKIDPLNIDNVGPISIDLTLDNSFGILTKRKKIKLDERIDYRKYIKKIKVKEIVLKPGDFVLGITKERITLASNIAGYLSGRSRFARFGLLVHATAPLVHPGVSNKQVFEIKNISNLALVLPIGIKIGQMSFIKLKGKAKYEGQFKIQEDIK